jgi:hypothetical protein
VLDYQFTAQVEDWLDDVSRGERDWVKTLRDFYDPFALALASAPPKLAAYKGQYRGNAVAAPEIAGGDNEDIEDKSPRRRSRRSAGGTRRSAARSSESKKPIASDPNAPACPKCGSPMIKRSGPRGEFWGCSTYPKCKGTRNL